MKVKPLNTDYYKLQGPIEISGYEKTGKDVKVHYKRGYIDIMDFDFFMLRIFFGYYVLVA